MQTSGNWEIPHRYRWSESVESASSSSIGSPLSEHYYLDDENDVTEETWFTVPQHMVGYVIGRGGQNKNRIMEQTETFITTKLDQDNNTFFVVRGDSKNQYKAKLNIKQTVNLGILKNQRLNAVRFPVIDSCDGKFELHLEEHADDIPLSKKLKDYKLVLRDSPLDEDYGNTDYSLLSNQISNILDENKEEGRLSRIWCHFGRVYIRNVQPEEESKVYTLEELNNHLMPRRHLSHDVSDVNKWRLRFFGGIRIADKNKFYSKLEEWMSPRFEKFPPFYRYEFTYLTPTCKEMRVKEHYYLDDENDVTEETWFTVPQHMVGYVIGRGGQNKNRIMEQTETFITTKLDQDNNTFFVIRGDSKNQYKAKLNIKQTVNLGILKNQRLNAVRFPVIDSCDGKFELHLEEHADDIPRSKKLKDYKLVLRDSPLDEDYGNTDYSLLSNQISNILDENKEEGRLSRIWCHFGRVYIRNVQPEEESKVYTLEELNNHLMPRRHLSHDVSDVNKWRLRFFGGIRIADKNKFYSKLEEWMSPRFEKFPPFYRYEFTYLTPTCKEMRVKVFIEVRADTSDPTKIIFANSESREEVKNVLKFSKSYPMFYLCESTVKRAMVDIFVPSGEIDVRLIAASNPTSVPEDPELLNEVDILHNYVRSNLVINQDGTVELPQENAPKDFDLHYSRMSERKTYSVFSDDGEQFDVVLCYESPRDIKRGEYEETKNLVDIHLYYHEWETKLRNDDWDPQQIVGKIPRFLKCARSLAKTLVVEETTPPEILARGPKAQEAYKKALKSGQTKHRLVPIMFIGQSRAGKTSLLRSLKGEIFNPEEDSTIGVEIQRTLSKLEENEWIEKSKDEVASLDHSTARAVVKNLTDLSNTEEPSTFQLSEDVITSEGLFGGVTPARSSEGSEKLPEVYGKESSSRDDGGDVKEKDSKIPVLESEEDMVYRKSVKTPIADELPEPITEIVKDILKSPESSREHEQLIYSTTMDFAGQPVYQATHPVFLSPKGIYILVHSLENDVHAIAKPVVKQGSLERKVDDNCAMTNMDHLEFWLSFVASNTTNQDNSQRIPYFEGYRLPVAFLCCTHSDVPFDNQNAEETSKRILAHLKREGHLAGDHLMHEVYVIDNTGSGSCEIENEHIKKLRKDICMAAKHLPHINETIPIRWLKFEKELIYLVENKQQKYISRKQANDIALLCQVDIVSDELNTLLNYLHDLKIIIYFEDTNMIIIDTEWLLDMFVKVITVKPFLEWKPEFKKYWSRLEKSGILDRALVEHLWSNLLDEENTIDGLLTVMERFSLLCRWKCSNGSDIFIVPAMLVNSDAKTADDLLRKQRLPPLVVRFTNAHLPLGIFPRLLVTIVEMCNNKWPKSRQPEFYHNFCRFFNVGGKKGDFDLVITSDMRTITIGVISENDINYNLDMILEFCQLIMDFLKKTLDDMRLNFPWMRSMEFDFGIRCPICNPSTIPCDSHKIIGCVRDACVHFIPEKDLPRCYNNPTSSNTFIEEEVYSHWFPTKTEDEQDIADTVKALALTDNLLVSAGTIRNVDATSFAKNIARQLNLDKLSVIDPPERTVKSCRELCTFIKKQGRRDIIEKLQEELPSGMTGPLHFKESDLVSDILVKIEDLTLSLCGSDTWKKLANELGIRGSHFGFYESKDNRAECILEKVCKKRKLTVKDLYEILCKCGANAHADAHL